MENDKEKINDPFGTRQQDKSRFSKLLARAIANDWQIAEDWEKEIINREQRRITAATFDVNKQIEIAKKNGR